MFEYGQFKHAQREVTPSLSDQGRGLESHLSSIYSVHTPGAEGHRIVHPVFSPCAQAYLMHRNTLKYGALPWCTGIRMYAPGGQIMHAGCRVHP